MTLAFPNPSRSFDEARNAVRFGGHDGMFEVSFFVEARVLSEPNGKRPTEIDCLAAFDSSLASIHKAARRAYSRGRRAPCILNASDFR